MKVLFTWTRGFGDTVTETVEYDTEALEGMTDDDIEKMIDDDLTQWLFEKMDASWQKIED